jgi:phi13 family phage major tail protein
MDNKVTYGLEQVHVAFATGVGTWEPPVAIPGAVRFTPTPQGGQTTFYADNGVYFSTQNNHGYTGELEMADIPLSVLAEMLGWEIDDNGMLVEVANANSKHFALMGQVEGDAKSRRFVYYDCEASRPGREHKTKGENVEPETDVLSVTIRPILVGGKMIVRGFLEIGETNEAVYNAWFDAVTLPNAVPSAVDKGALVAAIALAGTLVEAEYTVPSWSAFEAVLTASSAVNDDVDATQAEVNTATANLQAAILALVPVA